MRHIVDFFLRAKHWQIFLLLFGVFIVAEVVAINSMLSTAQTPEYFGRFDPIFWFGVVAFMLCYLGWLWSMGSYLNSIVQPALRLNIGFFRFALIYPALYVFVFISSFQSINPVVLAVIFPLHVFAMYCMLYQLYFVSKSLALAETAKPASFYDYAGPFFLIWFFPIGVWFIQPRVNRLYAAEAPVTQSNFP